MEKINWENIEMYMYSDDYFFDVTVELKQKITDYLNKNHLLANKKGIKIIRKICFDVLKMNPKKIDIVNENHVIIQI